MEEKHRCVRFAMSGVMSETDWSGKTTAAKFRECSVALALTKRSVTDTCVDFDPSNARAANVILRKGVGQEPGNKAKRLSFGIAP